MLRPGGRFLYADFRFREQFGAWERALASAPLTLVRTIDIRDPVLRGMETWMSRRLCWRAPCTVMWVIAILGVRDYFGERARAMPAGVG